AAEVTVAEDERVTDATHQQFERGEPGAYGIKFRCALEYRVDDRSGQPVASRRVSQVMKCVVEGAAGEAFEGVSYRQDILQWRGGAVDLGTRLAEALGQFERKFVRRGDALDEGRQCDRETDVDVPDVDCRCVEGAGHAAV